MQIMLEQYILYAYSNMKNLFNKTSNNLNTLIAGLYHLLKYNNKIFQM